MVPADTASERDVDDMFAAFARKPVNALIVQVGPVTNSFVKQITVQAARRWQAVS